VWTSGRELLAPYLPAFSGPFARPLVVELDWTLDQQEQMAPWYFGRPSRVGSALARARARQRAIFSRVALFTPMSRWAADGLRAVGVEDERIHVLHPGVDLDQWTFTDRTDRREGPLRLLFVGGDLSRKGGDLVIDAVAGPFAGRVVADLVTRDEVRQTPGVTVHRCEPNSPELMALFAAADLFVMPTRADCFGHAVVEAMASGLPAIVGDVGGVGEIVNDGTTGWRICADHAPFRTALADALRSRPRLAAMGARARADARARFDGRRNDGVLIDLMLELVDRRAGATGRDGRG
jgi:glycosyltransferase involved in cell wall biosynthesis